MAILFHTSQKTGQSFDSTLIMRIKLEAIRRGFMQEGCYVLKPSKIFILAGLRCAYTGRHESPQRVTGPDEREILYSRWKNYGHFVAGTQNLVVYDPLGPSNVVKYGQLKSKRIFRLRGNS